MKDGDHREKERQREALARRAREMCISGGNALIPLRGYDRSSADKIDLIVGADVPLR
jgi:hypothetical protein